MLHTHEATGSSPVVSTMKKSLEPLWFQGFLLSSRQVGKTTLLQKLMGPDRKYVTLDDPDVRYLAKKAPGLFMLCYTPPGLIDAIQYATELSPYIKMSADPSHRKGDFRLPGVPAHEGCQCEPGGLL